MRAPVKLRSGEGRVYDMGRIVATFKADGEETAKGYSVSEWRLAPNTKGPGIHKHPEDDLFYVVEGIMSIFIGDKWVEAKKGDFILAPGGIGHDFENRTKEFATVLNFSTDGEFEKEMPGIVDWFKENPPQDAV